MNLKAEFEYYVNNQTELLIKYSGKYIVIVGDNVVGHYNTHAQAYSESKERFELGTFLIQHCTPGAESYTQTFHSRVMFHSQTQQI